MNRTILNDLQRWKKSSGRKPLVLKGARQVGKTHSLKEFGQKYYLDRGYKCFYIDFRKEKDLYSIFSETINPNEILKTIKFKFKTEIDVNNDLIIFDEIQECPGAITSFKYFEQDLNNLAIIGAGSHLEMTKNQESFPVGKVNFLYMFPMTFAEFIEAMDLDAYNEFKIFNIQNPTTIPAIVHNRLLELLKYYFFTGGLPEPVSCFINHFYSSQIQALSLTHKIHLELIEGYKADFSKYSGTVNANHIHQVFESIPMQLSKTIDAEVGKFQFKNVISNLKGFERIKNPLEWLVKSRLCIKNMICKKAEHPLKSYCDENKFKIFMFDIGILNSMLSIPPEVIINDVLGSYKGFIAENFVAQELFAITNDNLFSWTQNQSEIEFLINKGEAIIPLEVKSSSRSRKAKSLDVFIKKYNPFKAYKCSNQNFGYSNSKEFATLPIYFCSLI